MISRDYLLELEREALDWESSATKSAAAGDHFGAMLSRDHAKLLRARIRELSTARQATTRFG
jgi:hypothetical protein